ncbi:TolC family protein [Aureivirga sp. CE67]|uniref:TolC family protein n=1 Tax=Aureivirga sp. CE67 TaxID=1788983 RepID=UPI0018CBD831|nr:TolC family protein [Aureivirga sp. CE67]
MRKNVKYIFILFAFMQMSVFAQGSQSLSLNDAVDLALRNNFDIRVAENDIKAAKKKKWETTATGLPQIDISGNFTNNLKQQVSLIPAEAFGGTPGQFEEVTFGTKYTMGATATLNQLIFDGSYIVGLQSAKTYLQISEQAKQKTKLGIREATINAYGNVLIAERSITILENNKEALEKNLFQAKEIFKNGLNEEEDVEQLQITLSTVENQLNRANRLRDIAYQMLNITLGQDVNTPLSLTENIDVLVVENIDFSLMTTDYNLEDLIDYKIASTDRKSKELLLKLEKSRALPSLTGFLNFGYSGNSNEFNFHEKEQKWFDASALGLRLNVPIFSSFGRDAKTKQAKIALNTADIKLENVRQQLKLGVDQARTEYQFSIDQFNTSKQNLKLAERIETKQQTKFFEGISTSFDLLQAQNQLYTQQQNLLQAMLEVISKKAALEKALNVTVQ